MTLEEIIYAIIQKHRDSGIKVSSRNSEENIICFEKKIGFLLPADFKDFYMLCDGLECEEDMFRIMSLDEIARDYQNRGGTWFYFSEYMTYCDMWGLRIADTGVYEIFNGSFPKIAMTNSLADFLLKFLKGNIFETGGLYDWHVELGIK